MKQLILSTIFLLFLPLTTFGQKVVKRDYKSFSDTIFKIGDIILAPKISFQLASCDLLISSNDSLNVVVDFLKKHPTFQVEIGYHTDNRVSQKSSMHFSVCRAEKIQNYLLSVTNLPADNILAKGYENANLIVGDIEISKEKNKDKKEELHAKNRRVEIKILGT